MSAHGFPLEILFVAANIASRTKLEHANKRRSATPTPKSRTDLSAVVKPKQGVFALRLLHLQLRPTHSNKKTRKMSLLTDIPRQRQSQAALRCKASAYRRLLPRAPCRPQLRTRNHNSTQVRPLQVVQRTRRPLQRHRQCIRIGHQHKRPSQSTAQNQQRNTSPWWDYSLLLFRACKAFLGTNSRTLKVWRIKSVSQS